MERFQEPIASYFAQAIYEKRGDVKESTCYQASGMRIQRVREFTPLAEPLKESFVSAQA